MNYYNYYFQDRSWVKRVIVNRSVDEEFHEVITKKTFDIKIPDTYPSCEADKFKIILLDFVPKQSLLKFDLTVDGDSSFFINKSEQIDFFYNFIHEIYSSQDVYITRKFESELKKLLDTVCRYRISPNAEEEQNKIKDDIESFFYLFRLPDQTVTSNCRQLILMLLANTPIICRLEKGTPESIVKYSYSKPLLPDISYKSCITRFSPIENIETDLLFWDSCTNHYYLHYPKDVKVSTDIKVIEKYSGLETVSNYRCESRDNIVFYKIYQNVSGKPRDLDEKHGIYFRLFPLSLGIRSWSLWITVLMGLLTFVLSFMHAVIYTDYLDFMDKELITEIKKNDFSKKNLLPFFIAIGTVIISWFVRVPKNRVSEKTRAPHQVILFATMAVQLLIVSILTLGFNPVETLFFYLILLSVAVIIFYRVIIGIFYFIYNKDIRVREEYNPLKKSYLSSEH